MKKFCLYIIVATLIFSGGRNVYAADTRISSEEPKETLSETIMESAKPTKSQTTSTAKRTTEVITNTIDSILKANSKSQSDIDPDMLKRIMSSVVDSAFKTNAAQFDSSEKPEAVEEDNSQQSDLPIIVMEKPAPKTHSSEVNLKNLAIYVDKVRLSPDSAIIVPIVSENLGLYPPKKQHKNFLDRIINNKKIKVDTTQNLDFLYETVIVDRDTIPVILPQKNYGRYDRGLYNFLFIPKKQWALGLTASYGEFDTEDIQLFSLISNIDVTLKGYSIKPSVAYFFRHNQSIGLRFDYTHIYGAIDNLYFEYDDDINFNLSGVSYTSNNYSMALFYRNYVGLGKNGRFAIFNEVALNLGGGSSNFIRNYAGEPKATRTDSFSMSLDFSPGVCVFIQEYVSFNVSFGVFGLHYKHEKQYTNGFYEGTRNASGANFRFNLFNINFGIGIHI